MSGLPYLARLCRRPKEARFVDNDRWAGQDTASAFIPRQRNPASPSGPAVRRPARFQGGKIDRLCTEIARRERGAQVRERGRDLRTESRDSADQHGEDEPSDERVLESGDALIVTQDITDALEHF